jgi:NADH:ubiquinone reductase (H+-translocating)
MRANIPEVKEQRIVIIGGGFAGLKILRKLSSKPFQLVLVDKNNYHQFQPLLYQVATAGIEPSAISFPFRKVFQSKKNVFIRITEVSHIDTLQKKVYTQIGHINYDILVIAIGADTNWWGKDELKDLVYPMKSVSEALGFRNRLIESYEKALIIEDPKEKEGLLNIAVIGGGPTGVELTGTLAEMKRFILPKDYPELDFNKMNIYLIEASGSVLNGMKESSSKKAYEFLVKLGVKVWLNCRVKSYDGQFITLEDGNTLPTRTLVWAAGVKGNNLQGLDPGVWTRGNRIIVDSYNKVQGYDNIYAIGDIALMTEEKYPNGHPQVAQVAIQQAKNLANNLTNQKDGKPLKPFHYRNLGAMATVGRNLAVVDFPFMRFSGFFAWLIWMFVHLMSIVGIKNRILIFINWLWNYFTFDQSLRLIIRPRNPKTKQIPEQGN